MRLKDLTGQNFNKLYVLERADEDKWRNTRWWCLCDCGEVKIIAGGALRSGNTKSCGCLSVGRRNKPGKKYNTSGQNLKIWRKDKKATALLKLKAQVDFDSQRNVVYRDQLNPHFGYYYEATETEKHLWFAVLKQTINDIGLKMKNRTIRDKYDTTYYFQSNHKNYKMLEECCEALDLNPEYVVRILREKGVFPVPVGHFS